MRPELKLRQPTVDRFALGGGLELDSPPSSRKPGVVHDGINFEPLPSGGYGRLKGYCRFDGRQELATAAAEGTYWRVRLLAPGGLAGLQSTIFVGQTSGATGWFTAVYLTGIANTVDVLLVDPFLAPYPNGTAGGFTPGENVTSGTAIVGQVVAVQTAPSTAADIAYRATASALLRGKISSPGDAPILAGFNMTGKTYAIAVQSGAVGIRVANGTSAWQVAIGTIGAPLVEFDFKNVILPTGVDILTLEGRSFTRAGTSYIAGRIAVEGGDGTAGDPYRGRIIATSPISGSDGVTGDTVVSINTNSFTLTGPSRIITLPPSGNYEVVTGSFTGKQKAYIVSGVGPAYEFDGAYLVPIRTGALVDQPTHVAIFQNHLVLSQGSSVQVSSLGNPFEWSAVTGAAEFRVDGEVTGVCVLPGSTAGGAMAVTTSASHSILYGTSSADFKLVPFAQGTGARARSIASLGGNTLAVSSAGVTTLSATQNYGNFASASLTSNLNSWIQPRVGKVVGCCVSATKSQYKVFFSDGSGLTVGLVNGKFVGALPFQMPAGDVPTCVWGGEDDNGKLQPIFVGTQDGRVLQLDLGRSFDGVPINAYFELNFNPGRMPGVRRTLKRLVLEGTAEGDAEFTVAARVDQGSADAAQPSAVSTTLVESVTDTVVWSGTGAAGQVPIRMDGVGDTVAVRVSSTGYADSFAITSIAIHHLPRRLAR